jgi:hypothetical protein
MPVFGGGTSKFQPVYVRDIARLIELCSYTERKDISEVIQGTIIEAGGPEGTYCASWGDSTENTKSLHIGR